MSNTLSPNMSLIIPGVGTEAGPTYATDINSSLSIIDQHNHSSGSGVQINPAGLNINSALTLNNNFLTNSAGITFTSQSSTPANKTAYVNTNDFYFVDGNGNNIQITAGGVVNATSSGISSGTASASFSGGVLVVNAASSTPANIQGGSILLGNNSSGSKFLTLAPPASMGANYSLTLPTQASIPASTSFMSMDSSGNMGVSVAILGALTTSNLSSSANILGSQLSSSANINGGQIGSTTITGSNLVNNIDLAGKHPTAGSQNIVVSNTNDAQGLSIIRAGFNSAGTLTTGSGASGAHTGTGIYTISWSTAFGDSPIITITCNTTSNDSIATVNTISTSGCIVHTYGVVGAALADIPFQLIAIGMRQ